MLNASRRHGARHTAFAAAIETATEVLNASRRHGARHILLVVYCFVVFLCSTPRGVMERGTPAPGLRCGPAAVLNASRRHGARHPFTITSFATSGCAQRLAASWSAARAGRSGCAVRGWCSTPRGVMERGTRDLGGGRLLLSGAQRLAASWSAAHGPLKSRLATVLRCSTPRGVMERGTLQRDAAGSGGRECSTPRGVMERGTHSPPPSRPPPSVLNASRRHGARHTATLWRLWGRVYVLNASRRHGARHVGVTARTSVV